MKGLFLLRAAACISLYFLSCAYSVAQEVDEEIPDSNEARIFEQIRSSEDISNNEFLNAPLTKLDYILIQIEEKLSSGYWVRDLRQAAEARFDPIIVEGKSLDPQVSVSARFYEEKGKIVVSYGISDLGHPKSSIKDMCEYLLGRLQIVVPQFLIPPINRQILGVLTREDGSYQSDSLLLLAKNTVHKGIVQYLNDKDQKIYIVRCWRESERAPVLFEKLD